LPALRQAVGQSVRLRVAESRNNKFALTVAERRDDARPPENAPGPGSGRNVPGGRGGASKQQTPPPTTFGAPP